MSPIFIVSLVAAVCFAILGWPIPVVACLLLALVAPIFASALS